MIDAPATVYCDGSGGAQLAPGGVGYVATIGKLTTEGSLPLPRATNQIAEILAAAYALDQIPPCRTVTVISDSQYVVQGMNEWLPAWVARGWRTSAGREVKNQRQWQRLLAAIGRHGEVSFGWVRGHNGTPGNERADVLAGQARQQALRDAQAVVA